MLKKLIKTLEAKLEALAPVTHEESAGATTTADVTMERRVMRFQGRYSCGCVWPKDLLAPEFCEIHPDATRVYALESVMIKQAENVEVPSSLFHD